MTRLLLALLLCAACKHSTSSSSTSHSETSTVTDSTSSETGTQTTVTTTSEAPGKTVTVTEEYAIPEDGPSGSAPSVGPAPADHEDAGVAVPVERSVRPPVLVRRTTTTTEHGQETTQTRQEAVTKAEGASETRAAVKGDTTARAAEQSAPSAGCIGASWMIGIGILLFAVALILGVLKFRKAV